MEALLRSKSYTYADYCTWGDDERWELIDGLPYSMSPAPSPAHQQASVRLLHQFSNFLDGKPCQVFHAPLDVRLNALGDDDDDVFQPDILVVCDRAKIDNKGINGAPDIAVEILSPSSAIRDKVLKFKKYQRIGVREYWIVDPADKTVTVFILENGNYIAKSYSEADTISVHIMEMEGCEISLPKVFTA
jgi:Uma2 family endonuclease